MIDFKKNPVQIHWNVWLFTVSFWNSTLCTDICQFLPREITELKGPGKPKVCLPRLSSCPGHLQVRCCSVLQRHPRDTSIFPMGQGSMSLDYEKLILGLSILVYVLHKWAVLGTFGRYCSFPFAAEHDESPPNWCLVVSRQYWRCGIVANANSAPPRIRLHLFSKLLSAQPSAKCSTVKGWHLWPGTGANSVQVESQ